MSRSARLRPHCTYGLRARVGLAGILAATAGGACAGALPGVDSPARTANRIAESVLHHMMAGDETGPRAAGAAWVCVALGPVDRRFDPDSLFLARFKDAVPPVRPWSECALDAGNGDRLVHTATGAPAIGYTLEWPRHVNARRVHVAVAYYVGALDAAGFACELTRTDAAGWEVESCKRRWIA